MNEKKTTQIFGKPSTVKEYNAENIALNKILFAFFFVQMKRLVNIVLQEMAIFTIVCCGK